MIGPLEPILDVLVAMASGAFGYLPTLSAPAAVADAVDALLAGDAVLPRAMSFPLVQHLRWGGRGIIVTSLDGRPVELTNREWEVLVLLRQAEAPPRSRAPRGFLADDPDPRRRARAQARRQRPQRVDDVAPPLRAGRCPTWRPATVDRPADPARTMASEGRRARWMRTIVARFGRADPPVCDERTSLRASDSA